MQEATVLATVLATLLHLLAFAYWLGGDIGAFYASMVVSDAERPVQQRVAAAEILAHVDLAPRLCLILALPTGLSLAAAKGWLVISPALTTLAFALAGLWIVIVLRLHSRRGPAWLPRLDFALRIALVAGLVAAAVAGGAGIIAAPLFITLKFLLLAFCVAAGLAIRRALADFGPAFARLAASSAEAADEAAIGRALARARPLVVAIWCALGLAALLGVARPL